MNQEKQNYEAYVKTKTPVHNVYKNMAKAFVLGGIICVVGQGITNYCKGLGLEKEACGSWTALILVLLSVVLTGFNVYQNPYKEAKIQNYGVNKLNNEKSNVLRTK